MKILNTFLSILIICLWLIPAPVQAADPLAEALFPFLKAPVEDLSINGDTVSIVTNKGDVKVTPHTLSSSGWVTVQYYPKEDWGDVDICFGFDGKYDIKPTKVESWEVYDHVKTRIVEEVVTGEYKPISVMSIKPLERVVTVNIGDISLNSNIAEVQCVEQDILTGKSAIVNRTIAYSSYNEKTGVFSYKYLGQKAEEYTEAYLDWKQGQVSLTKSSTILSGTSDWKQVRLPQVVTTNQWYEARFWVDIPFGGIEGVTGKYNVAVKPVGLSLADAKSQNKIVLLDPWYSATWGYRKELTVYGSSNATQTNYQKLIRVYKADAGVDVPESLAQYTTGDDTNGTAPIPNVNFQLGQTFTAVGTGTVKKIWLKCNTVGTPTNSERVGIKATNLGLPTGAYLCSGNITTSYVIRSTSGSDWYEFDMGAGTSLTSGAVYAIVMDGAQTVNDFLCYRFDTHSGYTGGGYTYSVDGGTSWVAISATNDAIFQVITTVTGTTPLRVDTEGKCLDAFGDLRFTSSDGTTLLHYWIESYVSGSYADVWVEVPSIPQMTGTIEHVNIYMYYGNSGATGIPNIVDTMEFGDDFEDAALDTTTRWQVTTASGSYAEAGGALTITAGAGVGANETISSKTATYGQGYQLRVRTKYTVLPSVVETYFITTRGTLPANGFTTPYRAWSGEPDGMFHFQSQNDGSSLDISSGLAKDTTYRVYDVVRISSGDFFHLGGGSTKLGNLGTNTARYIEMLAYQLNDSYVTDWIEVNKFAVSQPLWGTPSAEYPLVSIVNTLSCTGFGTTWAVVNGSASFPTTSTSYTYTVGFDYGLSTAYGSSQTATQSSTGGTLSFSEYLSGLTPATVYHYRARVSNGITTWYGEDRLFATKGSPVPYETWGSGGDSNSANITSANITYQTFTTNGTTSHSITTVNLMLKRVGVPGTVTASIRHTSNSTLGQTCWSYPTGADLASGSIAGTLIGTNYLWCVFTMAVETCLTANTTYAIVVQSPTSDSSNYVVWQADAGGGYTGGNAGSSVDSGITWVKGCPVDQLFEVWGNPCLLIEDAKVFSSYIGTGDWLVTVLYKNLYPPYYGEAKDVSSLFVLQLYNATTSTVIAQTKCFEWGYKPGAIYLSATGVIPLQWGYAYRVRLYGLFDTTGDTYSEYVLQPTDWMGSDLTKLDNWVRSVASLMEKYYNTVLTTYLAGRGIVLNSAGGVIFATDIPQLAVIRPNLFSIVTSTPPYVPGTFKHEYQDTLVWETMWGPQLTLAFDSVGATVGIGGETVGSWIGFMVYALVALFCFRPGHAIAAMCIPIPILLITFGTGLAELALMGILLAVATILFSWQVWWKGG